MTTEVYRQVKECFKPAQFIYDLQEIENDISMLNNVLFSAFFDESTARSLIQFINNRHPENRLFYTLINRPTRNYAPIYISPVNSLKLDLLWKKNYLLIKAKAKSLNETIHQLENFYQCNL